MSAEAAGRRFSSQLPAYSAEEGRLSNSRTPPQYTVLDRRRSSFRPSPEAPRSRTQKVTSEYHIRSGFGSSSCPWATLRLIHRSPASTLSPTFYGGENISGSITVDSGTTKKIHVITLQLRGEIMMSSLAEDSYTFLNHTVVVWSREDGNPASYCLPSASTSSPTTPCSSPALSPSPSYDQGSTRFDGKLHGKYTWPFSFPFPTEMDIPGTKKGHPVERTSIPQSFRERGVDFTVLYSLKMTITQGIFRKDAHVSTNITHIPMITPEPTSLLCRAASLSEEIPPSPSIDHLGWTVLPSAYIRGQVFRHRSFNAKCTLALSNPLCYVRGGIIPCFLTISSQDFEALDSLVPMGLYVRLTRTIKQVTKPISQVRGRGQNVETVQDIARAVWCIPRSEIEQQEQMERRLQGEIHLDPKLQPSCSNTLLSVQYNVELLPFDSEFFQCDDMKEILLSQEVTIATCIGHGPGPVAFSEPPPWYDLRNAVFQGDLLALRGGGFMKIRPG